MLFYLFNLFFNMKIFNWFKSVPVKIPMSLADYKMYSGPEKDIVDNLNYKYADNILKIDSNFIYPGNYDKELYFKKINMFVSKNTTLTAISYREKVTRAIELLAECHEPSNKIYRKIYFTVGRLIIYTIENTDVDNEDICIIDVL